MALVLWIWLRRRLFVAFVAAAWRGTASIEAGAAGATTFCSAAEATSAAPDDGDDDDATDYYADDCWPLQNVSLDFTG
jgi:hypothetical protein